MPGFTYRRSSATHIELPNGARGKIVARHKLPPLDLFDDLTDVIVVTYRPPRQARKGWTKRGALTWSHDATGWSVEHCGHPTALTPYVAASPTGRLLYAPNGRGFAKLTTAQAAAERAAATPRSAC